jgi:hypothetical protein
LDCGGKAKRRHHFFEVESGVALRFPPQSKKVVVVSTSFLFAVISNADKLDAIAWPAPPHSKTA